MKKVTLSKRLQAVANMVPRDHRVCDVGCDHGFVSIYLVEQGISSQVLALDVNEGPLQRAREHINERNLSDYIEIRLSDGVAELPPGETDTLILAGMGGRLMTRILSQGADKILPLKELVLQPQSEIPAFRRFVRNSGYRIVQEEMVLEDGKFYTIMKVLTNNIMNDLPQAADNPNFPREEVSQEIQDRYGSILLAGRHPVLYQYLLRKRENNLQLQRMLQEASVKEKKDQADNPKKQQRREALQKETQEIEQLLKLW